MLVEFYPQIFAFRLEHLNQNSLEICRKFLFYECNLFAILGDGSRVDSLKAGGGRASQVGTNERG